MSRKLLIAAVLLVAGLAISRRARAAPSDVGGEGAAVTSSLGIRNNNPLNVRETSIDWLGELEHDRDGYEDFATAGDGIRAGAKLLHNYYRFYGLDTVEGVISRWAPPSENPTREYIRNVARWLGVDAEARLDMASVDGLAPLVKAIIRQENGEQPYSDALIRASIRRALYG